MNEQNQTFVSKLFNKVFPKPVETAPPALPTTADDSIDLTDIIKTPDVPVPTNTENKHTQVPEIKLETQPELNNILSTMLHELTECKLLAYVNIERDELLAIAARHQVPDLVRQYCVESARNEFCAKQLPMMARAILGLPAEEEEAACGNDIDVTDKHLTMGMTVFFVRAKQRPDYVMVLFCCDKISQGMTLIHVRELMWHLEKQSAE